jgi:hypothetical protein
MWPDARGRYEHGRPICERGMPSSGRFRFWNFGHAMLQVTNHLGPSQNAAARLGSSIHSPLSQRVAFSMLLAALFGLLVARFPGAVSLGVWE